MTTTPAPLLTLAHSFADDLPELALPWEAAEAPEAALLALNEDLAGELGLDPDALRTEDGVAALVGNRVPDGATPVAQVYAGHQFGGFAPRLGDGRALLLGDLVDVHGARRDLHLKGSGRTPFARGGDGFAAVGPMLREYVVGEAMHALGVPTTRALAVVATGRPVQRETVLPGAVLTRVAASHLRVGSFQFARATGDLDLLRSLVDHAIARHHPGAAAADNPALALFDSVVGVQAELVAHWMSLGFVHGVLNTDNVTISGETIDYGPCAFLDAFDPATVFSSIDEGGRYAYGNQPAITEWNLARLAEALLPAIADDEGQAIAAATEVLQGYRARYGTAWSTRMHTKLGLERPDDREDDALVTDLLELMHASHVDFTGFFRALGRAARGAADDVRGQVLDLAALDAWLERWRSLSPNAAAMDRVNPIYIPRNHLVEQALESATGGDLHPFERLVDVVTHPFTERPGLDDYAQPAPTDFGRYVTYCGT